MTTQQEYAQSQQRHNTQPPPAATAPPDSPPYSSSLSSPLSPLSSHSQFSSPQLDEIQIPHSDKSQQHPHHLYPLQSSPPHALHAPHPDGSVDRPIGGESGIEGGGIGDGGGKRRVRLRPDFTLVKSEGLAKRVLLVSRVLGFVFCLISFSVMAADKKQGWALDSFYRYKEFRYCIALNVIGFAYSGVQGFDLAYQLATGKVKTMNSLRYQMDFLMDQTLTYLLLSASSSAAVRAADWESNWGKDKFPQMAKASVALSFLAFVSFASSSLVSGYSLYTLKSR